MSEGLRLPVGADAKRVLREIGLNANEIDTYLALLETGQMTAMDVSLNAKIPYSKIYDVLNSLKTRGWVKSVEGRPSRYYSLSPLEAISAEKLKLEDKEKSWERVVVGELQPLYEKREVVEHSDILVLHSQQAALTKLEEVLRRAAKDIMVAAPEFAKAMVSSASLMLENFRKERVEVKVMVAGEADDWEMLKRISDVAELRLRDRMFGGGVIVDSKEAMLLLGEKKPSLVIWSNHLGLVRFARDYFEFLWNSSQEWK